MLDNKTGIKIIVPTINTELLDSFLVNLYVNTFYSYSFFICFDGCSSYESKMNQLIVNHKLKSDMYLTQSKNEGAIVALNKAIKFCDDVEYVGIFNDDVLFSPPSNTCWLTKMIKYLDNHPKIAACSANWYWPENNDYQKFLNNVVDEDIKNKDKTRDGLQACFYIIRKNVIDELIQRNGYFIDEGYFFYWADPDLVYRINKLGYECKVLLDVNLFHIGGATASKNPNSQKWYDAGKERFLNKFNAPKNIDFKVWDSIYYYKQGDEMVQFK